MSYVASIIIRDAAEKPKDVAAQAKTLIASNFSSANRFPSVRVFVTPIKQRRDFGIAEIDVTQSRDSDALSLLKDIFFFLCGKTDWGMELDWDGAEALSDAFSEYMRRPRGRSDPVVYDPYADEELDNSYWD
ncbi:hypothetical protein [Corynebacterium matruchotii]|uniref:Uncharacterized protein n=1 Tax=Corynebacterium matruchotii ATCC 14266 TaxID=553207 RepID=E0DGV2_9CORY|nr:hypothetical protein [Corynebacterium matruchotii]EFM48427.1 hypothetical protein HMPREF0299_7106 [Corynebacterium matruchotii ATCC 14266]KAB1924860.1 hypothetical protein F8196_06545 [Corynebacterium matruchotii]